MGADLHNMNFTMRDEPTPPSFGDLLARALITFAALSSEQQAAYLSDHPELFTAGKPDRAPQRPLDKLGRGAPYTSVSGHDTERFRVVTREHAKMLAYLKAQFSDRIRGGLMRDWELIHEIDPSWPNPWRADDAEDHKMALGGQLPVAHWYDGPPHLDPWFVDLRRWVHSTQHELTPSQAYLHAQAAADLPTLDQAMIARVDAIMTHLGYEEVLAEGGRAVYRRKR